MLIIRIKKKSFLSGKIKSKSVFGWRGEGNPWW